MWKRIKKLFHLHNYQIIKEREQKGVLTIGFKSGPATMIMVLARCSKCGKWKAWMEGSKTGIHLKNMDVDEVAKELDFDLYPWRVFDIH